LIRSIAIAILVVLLSASRAPAQDTSEKPEGIICLQPACEIMKSLPASIEGPLQAEAFLVDRARGTPTTLLDPRLPEMTFAQWLYRALQLELARPYEYFADWSLAFCDERASAFPRAGPDLCVEVSVPVQDDRVVKVMIAVAEGQTVNGQTGWQEIVPVIHDVYIERMEGPVHVIDSLDVGTLADLPERLRLPFKQWPTIDLKSAIVWSPKTPAPGDVVRFTIAVANAGRRDADRAAVSILIGIPQADGEELKEIRREWFPRVAAGTEQRLDISATLPRGDAMVSVHVDIKTIKRAREINVKDNDSTAVLLPKP
jgi:hypothetical protein